MSTPAGDERCPSVANVVERADGGLVRIRVPGGRISAAQLRLVAVAAGTYGNGTIELTNRANLQLRGIRPGTGAALASDLEAAGLSHGAAGDLRRNILAGPLAGIDPDEVADVSDLIPAVIGALDAEPDLDRLPAKWGVVLDGGGRWGPAGRRDDVVVTATASDRFEVRSQFGCGAVDADGVPAAVAAAGRAALDVPRRPVTAPGVPVAAGPLGTGTGWAAGMPWLGRLDPAGAMAVADAAETHGRGAIRLTPWRSLLFPSAGPAAIEAAGLIGDPTDPATGVVACAGSAGCTSGLADAPADARRVARTLSRPVDVHVSGCARRCAHPGPATVTYVAVGHGRYDRYDAADRLVAAGVAL